MELRIAVRMCVYDLDIFVFEFLFETKEFEPRSRINGATQFEVEKEKETEKLFAFQGFPKSKCNAVL